MTHNTNKNESINLNILKVQLLILEEIDEMFLDDNIYEQGDNVLMKYDRCRW